MEESFSEGNNSLGIILNLSSRSDRTGARLTSIIHKKIAEFLTNFESEDIIYIYQKDVIKPCKSKGSACSLLGNLESIEIDLEFAFKQTIYLIANEDPYNNKYVIYLTDRCQPQDSIIIKKCLNLVEKDDLEVNFILISLGNNVENLPNFRHLNDPNQLNLKSLFDEQ